MGNSYRLLVFCLVCVLCFGCAHKHKPDDSVAQYERFRHTYEATAGGYSYGDDMDWDTVDASGLRDPRASKDVVRRARRALGTPYVFGGENPGGFDCSGLVQWAYRGAGIRIPRTAAEQSAVGYKIRDVSKMRAGDIVTFRRSNGGYHTGIYLGDGKFIHAPRSHDHVRVESIESGFFQRNFIGARRVNMHGRNEAVAEAARSNDEDYGGSSRSRMRSTDLVATDYDGGYSGVSRSSRHSSRSSASSERRSSAQRDSSASVKKNSRDSGRKDSARRDSKESSHKDSSVRKDKDRSGGSSSGHDRQGQRSSTSKEDKNSSGHSANARSSSSSGKSGNGSSASESRSSTSKKDANSNERRQISVHPAGKGAEAGSSKDGGRSSSNSGKGKSTDKHKPEKNSKK